jgi:hypothetical protein
MFYNGPIMPKNGGIPWIGRLRYNARRGATIFKGTSDDFHPAAGLDVSAANGGAPWVQTSICVAWYKPDQKFSLIDGWNSPRIPTQGFLVPRMHLAAGRAYCMEMDVLH